jgi:hypothetical protein
MTGAGGVDGLNGRVSEGIGEAGGEASEGIGEAGGEASAADGALSKAMAEVERKKRTDKERKNKTELSSVGPACTAALAAGRGEDSHVVGEDGGPGRVYVRARSWGRIGGIDGRKDGGTASTTGKPGTEAAMGGGRGISSAPMRRVAKAYRAMSCWANGCCKRPTFGSVKDMMARRYMTWKFSQKPR